MQENMPVAQPYSLRIYSLSKPGYATEKSTVTTLHVYLLGMHACMQAGTIKTMKINLH